jgi:hypothetical protein
LKDVTLTLKGTRPLLQHNIRLVDPLDEYTRALSKASTVAKSKKTDEAHREMADVEFVGSLYYSEGIGPYVKAEAVERCLKQAAGTGFRGLGTKVQRGVMITSTDGQETVPLLYAGPRDVESLVADHTFRHRGAVKIGQQRVMRTRPRFPNWSLECRVSLDESQVTLAQFKDIATYAGLYIGIGDYRPRYGRFEASAS